MKYAMTLLCVCSLNCMPYSAAQGGETSVVRVVPVTGFGVVIQDLVSVEATEAGSKAQYQGKTKLPVLTLPFGIYHLRLSAPGFETTTETLVVRQKQIEYRIGLKVGGTHAFEEAVLSGAISPIGRDRASLWVKLAPLYNSGLFQAVVDKHGEFLIVGAPRARYILSVIRGGDIMHTEQIDIVESNQKIRVLLPKVNRQL